MKTKVHCVMRDNLAFAPAGRVGDLWLKKNDGKGGGKGSKI